MRELWSHEYEYALRNRNAGSRRTAEVQVQTLSTPAEAMTISLSPPK
jgi:hypothetical protein